MDKEMMDKIVPDLDIEGMLPDQSRRILSRRKRNLPGGQAVALEALRL